MNRATRASARLVPQVFPKPNEEASVPVTAMPAMDTASVPVLVMVTDCDALVIPIVSLPNASEVADRDTVLDEPPVTVTVTMLEVDAG